VTHESAYPGGAANVARNLSDFGVTVTICGLIGQDDHGAHLVETMQKAGISTRGVVNLPEYQTTVKTRIIARHQQVCRVDREGEGKANPTALPESLLESLVLQHDAIIIEDYGKGLIDQTLVDRILSLAHKLEKITSVDPNPGNPINWSGCTVVKPNRHEAYLAANIPYREDNDSLLDIGERLLSLWQIPYLLITLGEQGMVLFHPPEPVYHTPTRAREVYDVSGAGDTVIAFFTAALAAGLQGPAAAEIANHAAGIVVGKLGTATLTPQELITSFRHEK
jgi:D-beta-D-heptose 7-phosphate kinase/D-beta-D-heptose 1-phosphate adenosyltransferase